MSCGNAGAGGGGNKAQAFEQIASEYPDIPQEFKDRAKQFTDYYGHDLRDVFEQWMQRAEKSRASLHPVETVQAGDYITPSKMGVDWQGQLSPVEKHAMWTSVNARGEKRRDAIEALPIRVTKVEKRGGTVKITASADLTAMYRVGESHRAPVKEMTVTRTVKLGDMIAFTTSGHTKA